MTWKKLAQLIADMTDEQRRKPVLCLAMHKQQELIYGVHFEKFETDVAVCFEIADGDPVLKLTN